MSTAPPSTTADPLPARPATSDDVLRALRDWLPHQRWFPAKGTEAEVTTVAVVDLPDPAGEADVALHLLRLPTGALLQVPLVLRRADHPTTGAAIGSVEGEDGTGLVVVDGPRDPAFVRAWLAAAQREGTEGGQEDGGDPVEGMRVVSGEQSNTSVLLPGHRPPGILKVFRGVSTGPNPDVEVPLALSRTGWSGVPRPLAWLTAQWPAAEGGTEIGHLGVLSELVLGAEDGFELACRHAAGGASFGDLAEDLGRTTAQMHHALRDALPVAVQGTLDASAGTPGPQVAATLRARAAAAVQAAPVLADRAEAVERVLATVEGTTGLPPLQRVHGDYHLGQVLHSAERGWSVLDFEGEPQASAAERTRPDLALRDLAGMLRSLDYAAAVGGAADPGWLVEARARLVQGYRSDRPDSDAPADEVGTGLLRALELDKALYEVVYESRNRPDWVRIPLDGVDRLLRDTA